MRYRYALLAPLLMSALEGAALARNDGDGGPAGSAQAIVICINGVQPTLQESTIPFELNQEDGPEMIRMPEPGAGYITIDLNGDGSINNGSELIGAHSGDPFGDLRALDGNDDNWLDTQDEMFFALSVWQAVSDDSDSEPLVGLYETGVGAIFLDSDFAETGEEVAAYENLDATVGYLVSISPESAEVLPPVAGCKHGHPKGSCTQKNTAAGGFCNPANVPCTNNQGGAGMCRSSNNRYGTYCLCTGSRLSPLFDAKWLAGLGMLMVGLLTAVSLRTTAAR